MANTEAIPLTCPFCGSAETLQFREKTLCIFCGKEFDPEDANPIAPSPPPPDPVFSPLTILLSCVDPEDPVCRGLTEALEKRGHTVWSDNRKNRADPEWRRSFSERLEQSQGVLAFLDRKAVRDPGVCLDELAVAFSIPGLNIVPILRETERQADVPVPFCTTQYLDVTDGPRTLKKGQEEFDSWLKGATDIVLKVLEDPMRVILSGGIQELQDFFFAACRFRQTYDLLGQPFVGRQWLTSQVSAWLDRSKGPRLCVLSGDPGMGKSAFASCLMLHDSGVAAALFLDRSLSRFSDPRDLLKTLASLVACRVPDYRTRLLSGITEDKALGDLGEADLFRRLFTEPLKGVKSPNPRKGQCIILDGLDECDPEERDVVLHVLKDYLLRLPPWLRMLVITRDTASLQVPPKAILPLRLRAEDIHNRKDIQTFFESLSLPKSVLDPKTLALLTERSEGNFLCAGMLADGILSGDLLLSSPATIPVGLSETFPAWMGWRFPDSEEYRAVWRPAVNMMLASPEPLPREELGRVLGWDESRESDFVRRLKFQIRREISNYGKETLAFRHPSLSRWLQDPSAAGPYGASTEEGIAAMAEGFLRLWQAGPKTLTAYEALHLLEFLERSGNTDAAREISMDLRLFWRIAEYGEAHYPATRRSAREACWRLMTGLGDRLARERGTEGDRRAMLIACFRYGELLKGQKRPGAALPYFERCRDLGDQLVKDLPSEEQWCNCVESYLVLASTLEVQGELEKAAQVLQTALPLVEEGLRQLPDSRLRPRFDKTCINLGNILKTLDRTEEAMELYRKLEGALEERFQEESTPANETSLLGCRRLIADLLRAEGKPNEALSIYQKIGIRMTELANDSRKPEDLELLQKVNVGMADVLLEHKLYDEALQVAEQAETAAHLLVQLAHSSKSHILYAASLSRKGQALVELNRLDESLDAFRNMEAVLNSQVEDCPTLENRRLLADSQSRVAFVLYVKKKYSEALEWSRRSVALQEEALREDPDPVCREKVATGYCYQSRILEGMSLRSASATSAQKAVTLLEQVVREAPTPQSSKHLAMYSLNASILLSIQLRPKEALSYGKESLRILRELVQTDPAAETRFYLSRTLYQMGDLAMLRGKKQEARGHYEEAMAIAEDLVEEDSAEPNKMLREQLVARLRLLGG